MEEATGVAEEQEKEAEKATGEAEEQEREEEEEQVWEAAKEQE